MKIIYLFRSLAIVGGVEKILIEKMNYLSALPGYEITLLTYEQGEHPMAFPLSEKVRHVDLDILFYTRYRYGIVKRSLMYVQLKKKLQQRIEEEVNRIEPDIIISTTYSMVDIEALVKLKDKSKKIIETHSAKDFIGKKSVHKRSNWFMERASEVLDNKLYNLIKKTAALITLTHADALSWQAIKEAQVIPNMLAYYPPPISGTLPQSKRVISAGRLQEQKGYDRLIQSWSIVCKAHPDWVLDIYGEGDDRDALQRSIIEAGLEQVVVLHPATNAIYEKYKESSFYVMSSRWEGFGLVLAEAMSCGIPCVSFDCPHGPSDIIRDGEDGLMVENGNIAQLAEKICYLIEHEDIRREMGRKARESVKRYLPENVMTQWETLFQSVTKNN